MPLHTSCVIVGLIAAILVGPNIGAQDARAQNSPIMSTPATQPRNSAAYNLPKSHLAIEGYDPVAYFPEGGGAPTKGDQRFEAADNGVTYRFASQSHLDLFKANPAKYEPAHGGWCSYAMGKNGSKVEIDPTSFIVADNRLFLFYKSVFNDTRASFLKDQAALTAKADANWKNLTGEAPRTQPSSETPKGFVLLELFTSEGCSSCPPADRVLSDLRARAQKDGAAIYPIAFHVDYWNNLGWSDRFSSAAFSARQRDYKAALHLSSMYTPEAIVNGATEFIGSDRERADREVKTALATPPALTVSATLADRKAGAPVQLEVTSHGAPTGADVCAALTEDDLSTEVKSGENGGRRLEHSGVVRAFAAVPVGTSDKTVLTLTPPADLRESHASIVVFIQEKESKRILGAAPVPLTTVARPGVDAGSH
jgi:YHS domain-containing protein